MMENSIEENKFLKSFKNLMKEDVDESRFQDSDYLRFLRARNHQLEKAEQMMKTHLSWRKQIGFEDADKWEVPDNVKNEFPYWFDGLDKDGRVVFYFPLGRWPVRQMIVAGYKAEMQRNIYHTMAKLMKAVEKSKREQFVIIIDLAELSYWNVAHHEAVQMTLRVLRDYEQNFPERLYSAIVINAPWVLNLIFPSIKSVLTGNTIQKLKIFDSNSANYLPELIHVIPLDGLPCGFKEYNEKLVVAWRNANNN